MECFLIGHDFTRETNTTFFTRDNLQAVHKERCTTFVPFSHQITYLLTTYVLIFFQVLERFLGSIPENNRYQQQILSMYLSCSGYTEPSNKCLDRVVCDYSDSKSAMNIKDEEKDVISM